LLIVDWLLLIDFQIGKGDIFKNVEKAVDNHMQIRLIACSYPPHFYYLQEGSGKLFETFLPGSGNPLEWVSRQSPLLI
jgi:hypothetical protein